MRLLGFGMVNKLGLGLGMVGHGAMRALDRPALLSGSCSCFVFFARREQQRH